MNENKRILVTGGAGYIGSHTVLQLIEDGCEVVVLDNLERGYLEATKRVEKLTFMKVDFLQADLRDDEQLLAKIKAAHQSKPIKAVVHFAAYKDVGEADKDPGRFYENNVLGTLNLLKTMKELKIDEIVFSSTSSVYGDAKELPITEQSPIQPKNAYGHTKAAIEWMLEDFWNSHQIRSVRLRYFNAAGAHPSGKLGEDPSYSGNVLPMIMQTLVGKREKFLLYGNQFATEDGTQERDYIHVMDLATAHVAALRKLDQDAGTFVYNLGTGVPTSVKRLIDLSEQVSGRQLKYEVVDPRPGDPLVVYCNPTRANQELQWKAEHDIRQIIEDQWRWVKNNPNGYQ